MTHFLANDQQPEGCKMEDLLKALRSDLVRRMGKIVDDDRPEAKHVFENDCKILAHLLASVALAEDSSRLLLKAFGPSKRGFPRIGLP